MFGLCVFEFVIVVIGGGCVVSLSSYVVGNLGLLYGIDIGLCVSMKYMDIM